MRRIYLDHNATTPLLDSVKKAMTDAAEITGNPSSIHSAGRRARALIEDSRDILAALLDVNASELTFCSGGSEADNLGILGVAENHGPGHIVASNIEHPAVEECLQFLENRGSVVSRVAPDSSGRIDSAAMMESMQENTFLCTLMLANNETGVLQPVAELASLLKGKNIHLHCDAVQALGRTDVKPRELGVHSLAISAHKIGGPKGCGALWCRPGLELAKRLHGGGQERTKRGGTENILGIAGFGAAAEYVEKHMAEEIEHWTALRKDLEKQILEQIPQAFIYGADTPRLCNTVNVILPGSPADILVISLDIAGLECGSGSACSSGALEPSRILLASGLSRDLAGSSLRLSVGRGSKTDDIKYAVKILSQKVSIIRKSGHS